MKTKTVRASTVEAVVDKGRVLLESGEWRVVRPVYTDIFGKAAIKLKRVVYEV